MVYVVCAKYGAAAVQVFACLKCLLFSLWGKLNGAGKTPGKGDNGLLCMCGRGMLISLVALCTAPCESGTIRCKD